MKSISKSLESWFGQQKRNQPLPTLGAREVGVMKVLWKQSDLSAQQVLNHFAGEALSLSTMQSTLERLHRKGLVVRQKSGRQFLYTAAISQSSVVSHLLDDISSLISDGDMAPMISGIMDFVGDENSELLSKELGKKQHQNRQEKS